MTWLRKVMCMLLPWPARHVRQEAIATAELEKRRSQARAAHAAALTRDISRITAENHFAETIAGQIIRGRGLHVADAVDDPHPEDRGHLRFRVPGRLDCPLLGAGSVVAQPGRPDAGGQDGPDRGAVRPADPVAVLPAEPLGRRLDRHSPYRPGDPGNGVAVAGLVEAPQVGAAAPRRARRIRSSQ